MAFNQNIPFQRAINQDYQLPSSASSINLTQNIDPIDSRYSELSSSGSESDWILFAPDSDVGAKEDILSSSNSHAEEEDNGDVDVVVDDDDDDENESLIESLNTANMIDDTASGNLDVLSSLSAQSLEAAADDDYLQSLQNNDYLTKRIDCWRKQHVKSIINDFFQNHSNESNNELMSSWGVDNNNFIDSYTTQNENFVDDGNDLFNTQSTKRFYGDDLIEDYSNWERSKIHNVAKYLSSSLKRDNVYNPTTKSTPSHLLRLTNKANEFILQDSFFNHESDLPFWKQDKIQSSIHSFSTNSGILLNTLAL
ncbi:hypothetical protein WICMUC_001099 [Wickerhamomyces mucosus]|uniref:Uncharacterized protein n=1 Tax=Wickerhamomyces mucosus TaxID=1378264 RepID=A0A9P8PXC3_9ASCO|nr:hypothetical protein WICMUC_001099 [Wickerhamomyces mucosus]